MRATTRSRRKVLRVVMAAVAGVAATMVVGVVPANAQFVLQDFGTDQGWDSTKHPRFVADITGDGRADIVGFFFTGVQTAVATGNGQFPTTQLVNRDFGVSSGWRIGEHDRFVTDITGDGRADIVGVRESGVFTAVASGDGGFGPARQVSAGLNSAACTIRRVADADGDGRSDLFCIRNERIDVALAQGDGGFGSPILVTTVFPVLGDLGRTTTFNIVDVSGDRRADILGTIKSSQGAPNAFATLIATGNGQYNAEEAGGAVWPPSRGPVAPNLVSDVTGDGFADLIFFHEVTWVARGRGDGTFASFVNAVADFGSNTRWVEARHLRLAADLNGDRRSDIVGFGDPGVFTAAGRTNGGFEGVRFASSEFGRDRQWQPARHPRFVADITGDGRPDIVGFGDAGIYTGINAGGVFV